MFEDDMSPGAIAAARLYVQKLDEKLRLRRALQRQGWSDNFTEFGIGNTMFQRGREIEVEMGRPSEITRAGSLEGWRELTEAFGQKGAEPFALTILLSIASPLLPLIGLSPMTVCAFGEPGSGKTIMARLASAVWRDPFSLMLPVRHSTPDRPIHFRLCGSLPSILDGAHLVPKRDLRDIVDEHGIGAGQIRRPEGTSYPVSWSGLQMIFVRKEISGSGFDSPVFDYPLAHVDLPWAKLANYENFGVVGAEIAAYLVMHADKVKTLLADAESKINNSPNYDPKYRNLVALLSCIYIASCIALKLNLLGFDPVPVATFALDRVRKILKMPKLIKADVSEEILNEVVRLRTFGKKQTEIAAETGVSVRSVKAAFRIAKVRGML